MKDKANIGKVVKWIARGLFILSCLCFCFYFCIRSSWKEVLAEEQMIEMVRELETSRQVPRGVKEKLVKIYPSILKEGVTSHIVDGLVGETSNELCPCRDVVRMLHLDFTKGTRSMSGFYEISLIWEIESRVSQEQCLNYYLEHIGFIKSKGVWEVAKVKYGKPLEEITDEQEFELILSMRNPSLYNKIRRPDLFENEMKKLRETFKDKPNPAD